LRRHDRRPRPRPRRNHGHLLHRRHPRHAATRRRRLGLRVGLRPAHPRPAVQATRPRRRTRSGQGVTTMTTTEKTTPTTPDTPRGATAPVCLAAASAFAVSWFSALAITIDLGGLVNLDPGAYIAAVASLVALLGALALPSPGDTVKAWISKPDNIPAAGRLPA